MPAKSANAFLQKLNPKSKYIVFDPLDTGIVIAEWNPGQPAQNLPPTQVHIIIPIAGGNSFIIRLKSAAIGRDFLAGLTTHVNNVWPLEPGPTGPPPAEG